MIHTIPSVVIENGSTNTRAGFSNDECPSMVFSSNYAKNTQTDEIFIGDDIYVKNRASNFENLEIYSLLNDGLIYNWDNLEKNWQYVFNKLRVYQNKNTINDGDNNGNNNDNEFSGAYPLVTTEPVWNTKKSKKALAQLAFEKFEVPSFALLKNPLCITYGLGRSNGLIIDIGGATTSITGVIDGNILTKSSMRSKYAGDYLNYQIYNYLQKNHYAADPSALQSRQIYNLSRSTGKSGVNYGAVTESFKNFDLNQSLLNDFKSSVLAAAQFPITSQNISNFGFEAKNYKLPDGRSITVNEEQLLLTETLFKPLLFEPADANGNHGASQLPNTGIIDIILTCLNKFRDTPDIINQLLSNIIVTGGAASIADIDKRIYFDLNSLLPNFQINCFCNPNLIERQNSVWIGAGILSSLNNFDGYVSKRDYQEFGEDVIFERFK